MNGKAAKNKKIKVVMRQKTNQNYTHTRVQHWVTTMVPQANIVYNQRCIEGQLGFTLSIAFHFPVLERTELNRCLPTDSLWKQGPGR